jgi:hypothetical protein
MEDDGVSLGREDPDNPSNLGDRLLTWANPELLQSQSSVQQARICALRSRPQEKQGAADHEIRRQAFLPVSKAWKVEVERSRFVE